MCNFLKSHNWSLESDLMTHLVSWVGEQIGLGKKFTSISFWCRSTPLISFFVFQVHLFYWWKSSGKFEFPWKCRKGKAESRITWELNSFIFTTVLFAHMSASWKSAFISIWSLFYGKSHSITLSFAISYSFYWHLEHPFYGLHQVDDVI